MDMIGIADSVRLVQVVQKSKPPDNFWSWARVIVPCLHCLPWYLSIWGAATCRAVLAQFLGLWRRAMYFRGCTKK